MAGRVCMLHVTFALIFRRKTVRRRHLNTRGEFAGRSWTGKVAKMSPYVSYIPEPLSDEEEYP